MIVYVDAMFLANILDKLDRGEEIIPKWETPLLAKYEHERCPRVVHSWLDEELP